MYSIKTNPLFLFIFPLSFFIFSTFFSFSFGDPHINVVNHALLPPGLSGGKLSGLDDLDVSKIFADDDKVNTTYLKLAAKETYRRDPSDGFRYYTGGWNITNPHYINSLGFSAIGPFITGILWFILFGLCLLCICCRRCCCCLKKEYGYSRAAYAISLALLILLTLAAITGTGFLYAGQGKFHESIVDTTSYVLQEANNVITRISELMNTLLAAKELSFAEIALPDNMRGQIDTMKTKMDGVMANIRGVTGKSTRDISGFLKPLRLTLLYLAAVLLILAVLGFVFSILGAGCLVYCLVIIGWILVLGTFILSGMFLLVYNAVSDTCVAMDEWLVNPNATSALESIIPKVNPKTANQISTTTKMVTYGAVTLVNSYINNIANNNLPPEVGTTLYFNQSGPLMPSVCMPYNSDMSDRQCTPREVPLPNATKVYESFVCQTNSEGVCITPGRITPKYNKDFTAAIKVSAGLYSGVPFAIEMIDSTFLKKLFTRISRDKCPSLRKYTLWMYYGFFTSSASVMLSLILWVVYARERRFRAYTKKIDSSRHHGYFD